MTAEIQRTPEEALAPIVADLHELRQRGFTEIRVRNPLTSEERKLVFPILPPLKEPGLFDDRSRMGMGLYREMFGQARHIGDVYINPKYPHMVGVHFIFTSLDPEEARIIAAELIDVAGKVETQP